MYSKKNKIAVFIACVFLTLLVGVVAGMATAKGVSTWYLTINKPSFNPPNSVFAPVWTVIYMLMGISLYLIVTNETASQQQTRKAILVFITQLILNFFWSFIFFGLQNLLLALIEIFFLWLTIVWMIKLFYPISKTASFINAPYLLWVSFATVLTASIYLLN